jgi:uncharacterized membrane protein required for colicin V production
VPADRHNAGVLATPFQDPPTTQTPELLHQLQQLGWVDHTALAVLLVFFVIGLFKGLIWQVSRIAILVLAYVAAGRFGGAVGEWFARTPALGGDAARAASDTPDTTRYLAYVLIFLVVLVAMSLLAMLLQRLAQKAGLGFFDRLGGGLLGVATGGCVVLFGLYVVNMFFHGSQLAQAAETSRALQLSRRAIDLLGQGVPDELRTVIALAPLRSKTTAPADANATGVGLPVDATAPAAEPLPSTGEPTPADAPAVDVPVAPVQPQQPPR